MWVFSKGKHNVKNPPVDSHFVTFCVCWHEACQNILGDQHPHTHMFCGNKNWLARKKKKKGKPSTSEVNLDRSPSHQSIHISRAGNTSQTWTGTQTCRAAVAETLHPQLSQDLIVTGMWLCLLPMSPRHLQPSRVFWCFCSQQGW